jgi:hypothetical protein
VWTRLESDAWRATLATTSVSEAMARRVGEGDVSICADGGNGNRPGAEAYSLCANMSCERGAVLRMHATIEAQGSDAEVAFVRMMSRDARVMPICFARFALAASVAAAHALQHATRAAAAPGPLLAATSSLRTA